MGELVRPAHFTRFTISNEVIASFLDPVLPDVIAVTLHVTIVCMVIIV